MSAPAAPASGARRCLAPLASCAAVSGQVWDKLKARAAAAGGLHVVLASPCFVGYYCSCWPGSTLVGLTGGV